MPVLDTYFYHKTLRLYTNLFGTLFNDIKIQRSDGKIIRVPIGHVSGQKYNERLQQNPDPNAVRDAKIKLPRFAFGMTSFARDPDRGVNRNHLITGNLTGSTIKAQYNRVPYKFNFTLEAKTKYSDDMFQIIEQICPVFNPSLQVNVTDNPDLDEDYAVTITMVGGPNMEDLADGNLEDTREITCVFEFEMEGFLYCLTQDAKIINTITLNYSDLETGEVDGTDVIENG